MRKILFCLVLCVPMLSKAQSCFEITNILVNSCGSPEGTNEMFGFRVGPNPLSVSDMTVNFPANSWSGVCQTPGTAQIVQQINSGITSCGLVLEPVNGILPANSKVLLITSTNYDPTLHPFGGLSDTLYVLFHCSQQTAGYFSNTASTLRTLRVSFGGGGNCVDEVSYLPSSLPNEDGAGVEFDADGNVTIVNNGCVPPVEILDASWDAIATICTSEGSVDLAVRVTGNEGGTWRGQGIIGSSFNPQGLSGSIDITYTVYSACGDSLSETHTVSVVSSSAPEVESPVRYCPGEEVPTLTIQGGGIANWYADADLTQLLSTGSSYQPSGPGTYYVSATAGACSSAAAPVELILESLVSVQLNPLGSLYQCPPIHLVLESAHPDLNQWSTGSQDQSITVTQAGEYTLTRTGYCNSQNFTVVVSDMSVSTDFVLDPPGGFVPFTVTVTEQTTNAQECKWFINGEEMDYSSAFSLVIEQKGEYEIKLVCSNIYGCSDEETKILSALTDNIIFKFPDVFSPNNDGINDIFAAEQENIVSMSAVIYNRWGNVVLELEGPDASWDGTKGGKNLPEGVYFFIATAVDFLGNNHEQRGTVTLLR